MTDDASSPRRTAALRLAYLDRALAVGEPAAHLRFSKLFFTPLQQIYSGPNSQPSGRILLSPSVGFMQSEAGLLLDIACDSGLDKIETDKDWEPAPVFALHALLRMGGPVLEDALPRLIARARLLNYIPPGDYAPGLAPAVKYYDFLSEALTSAIAGGGATALPQLASELLGACCSEEFWRCGKASRSIRIMSTALAALPLLLGDVAAGDAAATAIFVAIRLTHGFLRSALAQPRAVWQNLSLALSTLLAMAEHLAPFLRQGSYDGCLPLLRAAVISALADEQCIDETSPDGARDGVQFGEQFGETFARILMHMGVQVVPGDPACAAKVWPSGAYPSLASLGTSETVDATHGAVPFSEPAAPPCYPGDGGFRLARVRGLGGSDGGWAVPMHCAFPDCGADDTKNPIRSAAHAIRTCTVGLARRVATMALYTSKLPPAMLEKLAPVPPLFYCERCRSVAYCSQACQKAHWARGNTATESDGGTPFPAAVNWYDALHHHRAACRLMTRFFARAAARAQHEDDAAVGVDGGAVGSQGSDPCGLPQGS